ncbi:uncharacterized protein LOC128373900 [Scomber scombrus]|uniref:Uncharacterized protein LOC128373900 n=2 Tax=Scomber scombrus TaxID=13677 RepID=A0AAV1MRA9_SCOSC|nr:uncharacterized protein LOC133996943 isoform X2 [Scomber scombrus]
MKTSKPVLKASTQEECGVWLDTVQLKAKAKQKKVARPISKLLNPFVEGRGYSLAVALNFTQTKIEMPKTKQASISSFFAPKCKEVLKKTPSSDAPVWSTSPSTSTDPSPVASGTKRRRDMDHEMSDFYNSEDQKENVPVDHEWKCKNVTEPEAEVGQEQDEANYSPPQNTYCEFEEEQTDEMKLPERKRRLIETSSLPGDSQPLPQAWSQDPLIAYESEFDLTNQKYTTAKDLNDYEPSFLNNLQSEDAFVTRMNLEGKTSTQKSFKNFPSSQIDDEKVYSCSLSSNSPSKHSPLSHLGPLSNSKRTEPKTASPQKNIPEHPRIKANKEESLDSQFKWTKPRTSPLKKRAAQQQGREVDEDSLAMLFTQDSEGFRVIAHRSLQARSPLKDQSNVSTGTAKRRYAYKCVFEEEDEEDDFLFTQDSQGNMVIKH